MSRIESCINALEASGKKALIPYVVAGDPWPDVTVDVMHKLVELGADIIELGVPFSDPMAEGPVIQQAHERALEHGVSLKNVLSMVQVFRENDAKTPVVLMGYANPIEAMGHSQFAEAAKQAGVDGVLTVDIPPEEVDLLNTCLTEKGIDSIFLIAPTTSPSRIKTICEQATGYIYYVSLKGVTGAGNLDTVNVSDNVRLIKQQTHLPVCVGFGIKDAETARALSACADGIVVGSALVERFAEYAVSAENNASVNDIDKSRQALLAVLSEKFSAIAAGVHV